MSWGNQVKRLQPLALRPLRRDPELYGGGSAWERRTLGACAQTSEEGAPGAGLWGSWGMVKP